MKTSYDELEDKPSINGETVEGDKTFEDYGLVAMNAEEVTEVFLEVFGYIL